MKKWLSTWLIALGCFGLLTVALAADPPPSGSVKMTSKVVAIGIGVSSGDGTLTYQGKSYGFSIDGLSVADVGISTITSQGEVFYLNSITSQGEVFYLNKLSDFNGNFSAAEAGIAIAAGPSDTIMKNQNGVVIRLHGTQQ